MYVIIGGSTKCGTTSLYKYLSDHPEVSGAFTKETRFFLDRDYPIKKKDYEKSGEPYESLFIEKKRVKIEATPDYLHSLDTPERIERELKENYHLIFILRPPEERLISWYKFSLSRGILERETDFNEFLKAQKDCYRTSSCNQHELALAQGFYSKYLENYLRTVPAQKISIFLLKDINENPKEILKRISKTVGISPEFYDQYEFKVENKTIARKATGTYRTYTTISRIARDLLSRNKIAIATLKPAKKYLDLVIDKMTLVKGEDGQKIQIPERISSSYKEDWEATLKIIKNHAAHLD